MPSRPLAALDLGSNTFRLILAPSDGYGLDPTQRRVWQEIPRIAEGLEPGGFFVLEPLARAWAAIDSFQTIISQNQPSRVLAGATMAFRLAADGTNFLKKLETDFGWETLLLSGQEEAKLSALGVLSGLNPLPPNGLIFDIGGRSTEFIQTQDQSILKTQSLDLGVVSLTAQYIHSDPPNPLELKAMSLAIHESLKSLELGFRENPDQALVGTAGTVTTVAAMLMNLIDYDSDLVNNQVFAIEPIKDLFSKLANLPLAARQRTPGLHPRRADVIVAGLALTLTIMDFFQKSRLIVSDNSLLEGLWLLANNQIQL